MNAEDFAKQGQFKEAVIALIREKGGGVSFVEIAHLLAPFMAVKGDRAFTWPGYNTIVLWLGMSSELVMLIQELMSEQMLKCSPTSWLVYMSDHEVLLLPLATELIPYPEPHWLPAVFDLGDTPLPHA